MAHLGWTARGMGEERGQIEARALPYCSHGLLAQLVERSGFATVARQSLVGAMILGYVQILRNVPSMR